MQTGAVKAVKVCGGVVCFSVRDRSEEGEEQRNGGINRETAAFLLESVNCVQPR